MGGELVVILIVALIVFGPNKLPMLASHLAKVLTQCNGLKKEASQFWAKILAEQQLLENHKKAEAADKNYDSSGSGSSFVRPPDAKNQSSSSSTKAKAES